MTLPDDGRILVLRAPPDLSPDILPADRCDVATGFRPDHDALRAAGWTVMRAPDPDAAYAAAIVFLPRARAAAMAAVAEAADRLPEGAPLIVDGAKADGVDALLKALKGRLDAGEVFAKAHGKVAGFASAPLPDWRGADHVADGFRTRPGVFSADGADPGSARLADALPPLSGRVCDLGAGWGFLSRRILTSDAVTALDLVEADADALDCARANLDDPRAAFHWADATAWSGGPYDAVVTNPPFHAGRAPDPSLGRAFIGAAARMLDKGGRLHLVANRHLPYEAALDDAFVEVVTRSEGNGYKVVEARRPKAAARGRRR